jgi:hypothetical protein
MEGLNIFSGEHGLGGALTNPTEMARRKGCIDVRYPVTFHSRAYPDVELAYHVLASGNVESDDDLMANLIAQKFLEHPALLETVTAKGGVAFLENCSHFTNARSADFQSWEGQGRESRFIRNLVSGYEKALLGEVLVNGQSALF